MHTREALWMRANALLDAWIQRRPEAVPRAQGFRYTENGENVPFGEGAWRSVTGERLRWVIADPESDEVLAFASLMEGDSPCLVAFRARARGDAWLELEALVSRKGQSSIFAPERLTAWNPLLDEVIPEQDRDDRTTLRSAADRYFEGIERDEAAIVPFHPECVRFENGAPTTGNPDFLGGMGAREQFEQKLFSYIEAVRARRYPVLDVTRGLAGACVFLDVPGTVTHFELNGRRYELPSHMRVPRSVLLFEAFKVTRGQIREIQAFMINLPYLARSGWE